jgi:hypothetical protein
MYKRQQKLAVSAAVFALLAGCGGGGGTTTTTPAPVAATTAPVPANATPAPASVVAIPAPAPATISPASPVVVATPATPATPAAPPVTATPAPAATNLLNPITDCSVQMGNVQNPTTIGAVKVYAGNCVASITVPASDWSTIINGNGFFNTQPFEQLFYASFKDSFDFIVFVMDVTGQPPNFRYFGWYTSAGTRYPTRTRRNIGNMVLSTIIDPGFLNPIKGGPVLHEFAHEWANSGLIPSPSDSSHWGFSSVGGQLGGFRNGTLTQLTGNQWQAKGPGTRSSFGTAANGGNSIAYSELELFAMGLIPSSSVPDVRVALDGSWINPAAGIFSATNWQTISASSILAANPARIPADATGQKHFKIATVVLTPKTVLDPATLIELNDTLTGFSTDGIPAYGVGPGGSISLHNFYTATKGLATMRAGGLSLEAR